MDSRVTLLKEFYGGLPADRVKVETYEHGFPFLDQLLMSGVALEYGEIAAAGLLHKFKLSGVTEEAMDALLLSHIGKTRNVCLYFGEKVNSLFCYNLDNNHKTNNTELIPEMQCTVTLLRDILIGLGCEPLVIASGRGYHLWCRLEAPVDNQQLYEFMLRTMARAFLGLHQQGYDHNKIKANFYPDPRAHNTVSLRLFGSDHAKNKVFSRILTRDGLLDEDASWNAFDHHLREKTITIVAFHDAYASLLASI